MRTISPIKKGTKLTDKPKDKLIQIRVDIETLDKIDYVVEKSGLTRSEIIRKGIDYQYKKVMKK